MRINSANSKSSKVFLSFLTAFMMVAIHSSAHALDPAAPAADGQTETQPSSEAPSEDALAPSNADDADVAATEDLPAGDPEAETATTAETPLKVDPCPLPATEMAKTPDDLAKIQSDIDRYSLCMERASLLQRLNDVAMENQKKLQEANGGLSADNPGMNLDDLPDFDEQKQQVQNALDVEPVLLSRGKEEPPSNEWQIVKVSGSSGGLSAQLGKSDGTLVNVKPGEELPDGSTVNSVSATSVKITQDGENKTLKWLDNSSDKKSSGPNL